MKTFIASFIAISVLIITSCSDPKMEDTGSIKAYNIDFNWGEGGPNGFASARLMG